MRRRNLDTDLTLPISIPNSSVIVQTAVWANFLSEDEIQAPHVIPWQGTMVGEKFIRNNLFLTHVAQVAAMLSVRFRLFAKTK